MVKSPATFTIERAVLRRLNDYVEARGKKLGGKKSKSSIVEEALEWYLMKLEHELYLLRSKDLSIVK